MRRNLGTSFTECMCRILATNCTTIHWRIKLIITVEIVDSSSACVFHHIVLVRCFYSSVFKSISVFLTSNNSISIHRLLVLRIWNILKTQTITLEVLCCALLHIVTMSLLQGQQHDSITLKPMFVIFNTYLSPLWDHSRRQKFRAEHAVHQ